MRGDINRVCIVLFLAVIGTVQFGAARGNEVLVQSGFEHWISPWQYSGEAEFGLESQVRHSGAHSARIAAGNVRKSGHPQLQYIVPGVSAGDRLAAIVWYRAKDVADRGDIVAAMEYFDCNGDRCGIDRKPADRDGDREDWNKIAVSSTAPPNACTARVCLILESSGTVWFDDFELVREEKGDPGPDRGAAERRFLIRGDKAVQPCFGGIGYNTFIHTRYSKKLLDEVIYKRWRELNPSFARASHLRKLSPERLGEAVSRLEFMKSAGTEVYTFTDNPLDAETAGQRDAYAKEIADELEFLIRERGLTNIKHYCMSNEMSLHGWARLVGDLPKFKDYHRAFFGEFQKRNLDINLLATDASPCAYWNTVHWATQNMDRYTGVYGGHNYIGEFTPDDERFYSWFLMKMKWAAGMAREKNKGIILGEFGARQDGRKIDGVIMDRCAYWDTPQEPWVSIQVAEAAIAALNAGTYAMCYWTFMDAPSTPNATYRNQWGLSRSNLDGFSTRPIYYAYGLLSKYFRGPATVYRVDGDDPLIRAAVVRHHGQKTWSVAVVNRGPRPTAVRFDFPYEMENAVFRKYVYDPKRISIHPFGDLPGPADKIKTSGRSFRDNLAPGTLAVYTTAYDNQPPGDVEGLAVEKTADGKRRVSWRQNSETDLCYYRVFRSDGPGTEERQIASTIAVEYIDETADSAAEYLYRVVAVDQSGNAR